MDFSPCPKGYCHDQDKAVTPQMTLAAVRSRLEKLDLSILAETRRIDNGRLGIPVFLSVCGDDARRIMPTRKQMGKGATPEQAECSALMELMERYGFFTYWDRVCREAAQAVTQDAAQATTQKATQKAGQAHHGKRAVFATWDEAEALFGSALMPLEHVIKACHDTISVEDARAILNCRRWLFVPALRLAHAAGEAGPTAGGAAELAAGETAAETPKNTANPATTGASPAQVAPCHLPLEIFKALGEFNGSSAGNSDVESLLQGLCELVERHTSALASRAKMDLPTIAPTHGSYGDPVVDALVQNFEKNGVRLVLKDFSLGMPLPTVAVFAYDPATFPVSSELVFTAGTAASPAKAAARALTEVAQLAGDFNTAACYEASGLPKYASLAEAEWLFTGPKVTLADMPTVERQDICEELFTAASALDRLGYPVYALATTNPDTGVHSHYCMVPGLHFRERDANASLGLFAGRVLCEQEEPEDAARALDVLERVYGSGAQVGTSPARPPAPAGSANPANPSGHTGHFIPFFRGMLFLRTGNMDAARHFFATARPLQPDAEARALCAFYEGYTLTMNDDWQAAAGPLADAVAAAPDMKEYRNLYGVSLFRLGRYAEGAEQFSDVVVRLDRGSAVDWQNLGLCRKFLGDAAGARQALEAALSIDPSLEAARKHLNELPA